MSSADAHRMRGLRELLRPPVERADAGAVPAPAAAPDAAVELEATRARVLDEARKAGYAAGQAMAKGELERAVAAAEQDALARHAAEAQRLADAHARFVELVDGLQEACSAFEARLEPAAATLAMQAITRMLGASFADGSAIAAVCREALAEVRLRPLTLRVAAEDRAAIEALELTADVGIEVDAGLAQGECRLETHRGLYETGLAARLHAIADALSAGAPVA